MQCISLNSATESCLPFVKFPIPPALFAIRLSFSFLDSLWNLLNFSTATFPATLYSPHSDATEASEECGKEILDNLYRSDSHRLG